MSGLVGAFDPIQEAEFLRELHVDFADLREVLDTQLRVALDPDASMHARARAAAWIHIMVQVGHELSAQDPASS